MPLLLMSGQWSGREQCNRGQDQRVSEGNQVSCKTASSPRSVSPAGPRRRSFFFRAWTDFKERQSQIEDRDPAQQTLAPQSRPSKAKQGQARQGPRLQIRRHFLHKLARHGMHSPDLFKNHWSRPELPRHQPHATFTGGGGGARLSNVNEGSWRVYDARGDKQGLASAMKTCTTCTTVTRNHGEKLGQSHDSMHSRPPMTKGPLRKHGHQQARPHCSVGLLALCHSHIG